MHPGSRPLKISFTFVPIILFRMDKVCPYEIYDQMQKSVQPWHTAAELHTFIYIVLFI